MARHQEVDQLLTRLLNEIRAQLPADLVGLYLPGSLATGDFRPESSDIDLLAVTERLVSESEYARLVDLHERLARLDHPFAKRVEIAYIDRAVLRHFRPGLRYPTLGQGEKLHWEVHQSNWILECWMVREHGIALSGPPAEELIDPITREELSVAVRERLQDWAEWARDSDDPEWRLPRSHKAYVVETMCRALYTLAQGGIVSKVQATAWACQALPEPWRTLVERSQSWRLDKTVDDSLIVPVRGFVLWSAEKAIL